MMRITVIKEKKLRLSANIKFDSNSSEYIAQCREIEVATSGNSYEEAVDMLIDAVIAASQSLMEEKERLHPRLKPQLKYAQMVYGRPKEEIRGMLGV